MQIEDYRLKRQKVQLLGKIWIPDASMRAMVIMVHGIGEYSGCYEELAKMFNSQSIGFLAYDQRGHGRSPGCRGHAAINDLEDDLNAVVKDVRKHLPDTPVILFGHSMGGHIVLSYAIRNNAKIQGIIVSSPWLKLVKPPPRALVKLVRAVSRVLPWIAVSTGVKASQLTGNGTGIKSSKTDPLIHKKISIKLFSDLWKNGNNIMRSKHRLNVPLLLMHGASDRLTSCQASKTFAQNTGEYTTYKQWRGMYHNLLNDAESEAVSQYIMKWISTQIVKDGNVQNNRKIYRIA